LTLSYGGIWKDKKYIIMNKKIKLTESELIGVIKEIRNNIALRRRFSDGLDDNEIRKVIRVVMNNKYLEDYNDQYTFRDDVAYDVTDYFFDENNIMIKDGNNRYLYQEFFDHIKDEYESMIVKYYRNNQ
jgi:hypothetical protein